MLSYIKDISRNTAIISWKVKNNNSSEQVSSAAVQSFHY